MEFFPITGEEKAMLEEMGITSKESLFLDIPGKIRIKKLDLPSGLSEFEVKDKIESIS